MFQGDHESTRPADERAVTDSNDPYGRTRVHYRVAIVASTTGTSMALLATTFAVYGLSRSVLATAVLLVIANIPMLGLAPVSSNLLHRYGAALVYSVCDLVLFVVTLGLALVSFAGNLNVLVLFLWQLVSGIVLGLSGASYSVLPHTLAAPGKVPEYNAQLAQSRAVASLIGLFAGSLVVETIGTSWVFVIDALSFLAVPLVLVRVWGLHMPAREHRPLLRQAVATIRGDAGLRAAMRIGGITALLVSPIGSLFPAMAGRLGANAHFLSLQMAAFAIGGLSIAWVVGAVHQRMRWSTVIRASIAIGGAGLITLAHLERIEARGYLGHAVILLMIATVGLAIALIGSVVLSLIQVGAPDEGRTSVLTVYGMVLAVLAVVSGVAVGLLADIAAVWVSLALIGLLLEGYVLLGTERRVFGDLDRIDERGEGTPATSLA